jgi:hypothetical protein
MKLQIHLEGKLIGVEGGAFIDCYAQINNVLFWGYQSFRWDPNGSIIRMAPSYGYLWMQLLDWNVDVGYIEPLFNSHANTTSLLQNTKPACMNTIKAKLSTNLNLSDHVWYYTKQLNHQHMYCKISWSTDSSFKAKPAVDKRIATILCTNEEKIISENIHPYQICHCQHSRSLVKATRRANWQP